MMRRCLRPLRSSHTRLSNPLGLGHRCRLCRLCCAAHTKRTHLDGLERRVDHGARGPATGRCCGIDARMKRGVRHGRDGVLVDLRLVRPTTGATTLLATDDDKEDAAQTKDGGGDNRDNDGRQAAR